MAHTTAVKKLRQYLADPTKTIICPGVHDGLTARMALNIGFDALYMTGAGTAASRLGQPDLGLTTADDMTTNAAMMAGLDRTVPLIADADTGFGGPLMVARTVERYVLQGVAALHIEDQVVAKRCGHLGGKELVDAETFVARVRAAVAAREGLGADVVIIARSDALQGLGWDEAVGRLRRAVEVGADVVFLEGMRSREEMVRAVQDLAPTPCLLNMVGGGITPLVGAKEAADMGYKMVIWPMVGMTAVYLGMRELCRELKSTGKVKDRHTEDGKVDGGLRDVFELCGLSRCSEFDRAMGGSSFSNGA